MLADLTQSLAQACLTYMLQASQNNHENSPPHLFSTALCQAVKRLELGTFGLVDKYFQNRGTWLQPGALQRVWDLGHTSSVICTKHVLSALTTAIKAQVRMLGAWMLQGFHPAILFGALKVPHSRELPRPGQIRTTGRTSCDIIEHESRKPSP